MIDAGQLKVVIRDGRMLIALPNDVLFDSGKTDIKPDGQAALAKVAQVLATIADRNFLVAGHTDDVPIHTARFPSNWELSTARAVEVDASSWSPNGMKPAGAGGGRLRRVRPGRGQRHARAPRAEPPHRDRAAAEPLRSAAARRSDEGAERDALTRAALALVVRSAAAPLWAATRGARLSGDVVPTRYAITLTTDLARGTFAGAR